MSAYYLATLPTHLIHTNHKGVSSSAQDEDTHMHTSYQLRVFLSVSSKSPTAPEELGTHEHPGNLLSHSTYCDQCLLIFQHEGDANIRPIT